MGGIARSRTKAQRQAWAKGSPATATAWAWPDLVKNGVELPALMTAGRWKSAKLPARYTERQTADRGAVARYYQESGGRVPPFLLLLVKEEMWPLRATRTIHYPGKR